MDDENSVDVDAWFAARGLRLQPSEVDYSEQVRRSEWALHAPSRDHHHWVDLLTADGRIVQAGYGSGSSRARAMRRARDRYREEQEGGVV